MRILGINCEIESEIVDIIIKILSANGSTTDPNLLDQLHFLAK